MAPKNEFVAKLIQITVPLGEVRAKAMFGGYGLFLDGLMFGLVTRDDTLFLKADDTNRPAFEGRSLKPFGKMPYFAAPAECLKGWAEMEPWAEGAVEAARRAAVGKRKNTKPR